MTDLRPYLGDLPYDNVGFVEGRVSRTEFWNKYMRFLSMATEPTRLNLTDAHRVSMSINRHARALDLGRDYSRGIAPGFAHMQHRRSEGGRARPSLGEYFDSPGVLDRVGHRHASNAHRHSCRHYRDLTDRLTGCLAQSDPIAAKHTQDLAEMSDLTQEFVEVFRRDKQLLSRYDDDVQLLREFLVNAADPYDAASVPNEADDCHHLVTDLLLGLTDDAWRLQIDTLSERLTPAGRSTVASAGATTGLLTVVLTRLGATDLQDRRLPDLLRAASAPVQQAFFEVKEILRFYASVPGFEGGLIQRLTINQRLAKLRTAAGEDAVSAWNQAFGDRGPGRRAG